MLGLAVTTAPMAQLRLVLIPAYFVSLFIMLYLAAPLQARRSASVHRFNEPPFRLVPTGRHTEFSVFL